MLVAAVLDECGGDLIVLRQDLCTTPLEDLESAGASWAIDSSDR
jgi:hypothetical protein